MEKMIITQINNFPLEARITAVKFRECKVEGERIGVWVARNAQSIARTDYLLWVEKVFNKTQLDRLDLFDKWAIVRSRELHQFKDSLSQHDREMYRSMCGKGKSKFIADYVNNELFWKDQRELIDWSKPQTPFKWAMYFAWRIKLALCSRHLVKHIDRL